MSNANLLPSTLSQPKINDIKDALRYFISKMDLEMIEDMLEEVGIDPEITLSTLLNKLREAFDEFHKLGDTELISYKGECGGCNCNMGQLGYRFVGNRSKKYLDFLIHKNDNNPLVVKQCIYFKSYKKLNLAGEVINVCRF